VEELTDVLTALSEAVTNAIIHATGNLGMVTLNEKQGYLYLRVQDQVARHTGSGAARQPFYTSHPELDAPHGLYSDGNVHDE
jgi:anti-sigma regulatory factor (Ser/Thr protein kinase)